MRRPVCLPPHRLLPWALSLLILHAGCGSGTDAPSPGDGTDPTGARPPSVRLAGDRLGLAGLIGDRVVVSFHADAAGDGQVRVIAEPIPSGDAVVLHTGVDADGVRQDVPLVLATPLQPGVYSLFVEVDDGAHPPVRATLPNPLLVYPGVAGVAPPRSNRYGIVDDIVAFSRGEAEDGAGPLNTDGDALDGILVTVDATRGTLDQSGPGLSMDVASAGTPPGQARVLEAEGGVLTWFTTEADEGRSMNAANGQNPVPPALGPDLDQLDVLVAYLAPAVSLMPRANSYAGPTALAARAGGRLVFSYAEAFEGFGGTDLNGDGDVLDALFGYVDPLASARYEYNQIVFFRFPPAAAGGPLFRTAGPGACAFLTSEVGSAAGTDFNGDGDGLDTFLGVGDLTVAGGLGLPGTFLTLAGAAPGPPPVAPAPVDATAAFDVSVDRRVGYYLDEAAWNAPPGGPLGFDANLDAILGFVPVVYDTNTGIQAIPIGPAGALNSPPGSATMRFAGARLFFTAQEAPRLDPLPGTNGDADAGADTAILHWMDPTQPVPVALPVPFTSGAAPGLQALALDLGGSLTPLTEDWLALTVSEAANGGHDLNENGQMDFAWLLLEASASPAPRVHNPRLAPSASGSFPLTGIADGSPSGGDTGVLLRLTELMNGDLDADGDTDDTFFAYVPFASPTTVTVLDAGGDHAALAGGLIAVTASEAASGTDFDGDGDRADHQLRIYRVDGTVVESARPCSIHSVPTSPHGRLWAFLRDEAAEDRDLNDDGDRFDQVLGLWVP